MYSVLNTLSEHLLLHTKNHLHTVLLVFKTVESLQCVLKEHQRQHSEKKKMEEKPNTYLPNTCALMGDAVLNCKIEK